MKKAKQADGFVFFVKTPKHLIGSVKCDALAIKVGEVGYWQGYAHEVMDLPDDVAESAVDGSMFGWHCPAAQKAIEFAAAQGGAA